MPVSPVGPSATNVGENSELLDEQFGSEMFELLWGQERNAVPTLVDYAYEQIWKYLLINGGQGEQRLSDVTFAERLGISRTPVHQALERLVQDGLVRADPRRGIWTRVFTAKDIHEIYDLRGALEVLALRLAAPRLTPADLRPHLDLLRTMRNQSEKHSLMLFLQADLRLHTLFIRAADNDRLVHCLSSLRSQLSLFQVKDASYPQRMEIALDDHEHILLALIARDVEKAAELLGTHIAHAKQGVLADLFKTKEDTGSH